METFEQFRKRVEANDVNCLQNIRFWQNGRTIYSHYYVEDIPRLISASIKASAFFGAEASSTGCRLSCYDIEKIGVEYLKCLPEICRERETLFDAENGQACLIVPNANVVVSIVATDKAQCCAITEIVRETVIPDLCKNPRDNSLLNFLDTIYD